MTGSTSDMLSRLKSLSIRSRTYDSSTNASDPSHQPSNSRSDSSAVTTRAGGTNASLAGEYLSTGTDVVVEIIEGSLGVNVSPFGYEVSNFEDPLYDDSLSLSDRFDHTVSD
jgi:hypothetical protein